jgi:hypothetical protein
MKTLLSILLLVSVFGCSKKPEKTPDPFSKQLEHRNRTYSKTDVLLAMKYQVNESVIKAVSERIKKEIGYVVDKEGNYTFTVDTNYAATVRKGIEDLGREYQMPTQIVASILIDKELLELGENLPDAVSESVTERLAPPERPEEGE